MKAQTTATALGALALFAFSFATDATAQRWRPERLGCRDVNFSVDHDSIHVGRYEGAFRAIRLKVYGAPVEMFDLKVRYGNGRRDDLPVRAAIPAGGETRWIDLRGGGRYINRIEMTYRSLPTPLGKATVCAEAIY